jgi:hypothetical protein
MHPGMGSRVKGYFLRGGGGRCGGCCFPTLDPPRRIKDGAPTSLAGLDFEKRGWGHPPIEALAN